MAYPTAPQGSGPDGLNTPNHKFFNIYQKEIDKDVGALWFVHLDNEDQKMFFVLDIQVYPEYKRKGYGTRAFSLMEEMALEAGVGTIALSVFPHNTPAIDMYEKLGYVNAGENMVKQLV